MNNITVLRFCNAPPRLAIMRAQCAHSKVLPDGQGEDACVVWVMEYMYKVTGATCSRFRVQAKGSDLTLARFFAALREPGSNIRRSAGEFSPCGKPGAALRLGRRSPTRPSQVLAQAESFPGRK